MWRLHRPWVKTWDFYWPSFFTESVKFTRQPEIIKVFVKKKLEGCKWDLPYPNLTFNVRFLTFPQIHRSRISFLTFENLTSKSNSKFASFSGMCPEQFRDYELTWFLCQGHETGAKSTFSDFFEFLSKMKKKISASKNFFFRLLKNFFLSKKLKLKIKRNGSNFNLSPWLSGQLPRSKTSQSCVCGWSWVRILDVCQ